MNHLVLRRTQKAAAEFLANKAIEAGAERFCDAEELGKLMRRVQFTATYLKDELPADPLAAALRELAHGCTSFADMRANNLLDVLQRLLPMRRINEIRADSCSATEWTTGAHRISRRAAAECRFPIAGFLWDETHSDRGSGRGAAGGRITGAESTSGTSHDGLS